MEMAYDVAVMAPARILAQTIGPFIAILPLFVGVWVGGSIYGYYRRLPDEMTGRRPIQWLPAFFGLIIGWYVAAFLYEFLIAFCHSTK